MREEIIKKIEKEKIIAIIRGVNEEKLIPLVQALYDGGIKLIEVTFGKDSDEKTAENIRILVENFGGKMYIGAGTVLTEKQVELTAKAGGKFIISPDVYDKVIRKTVESGMVSMPGAFSPTEIRTALRAGADFVKIFPTSVVGAKYIKAIKAPLSDVKLLAVGGVNLENMAEFFSAGVCGFGIGANIIDKKMLEKEDFAGITELAKKYVQIAKTL